MTLLAVYSAWWWAVIAAILVIVIFVVLGFIAYYKVKAFVTENAISEIDNAEDLKATGEEKLKTVVDKLYDLLPDVVQKFVKKTWIEKLVQKIFDKIKDYAIKQVMCKSEEASAAVAGDTDAADANGEKSCQD